jgi:hypothetical protein
MPEISDRAAATAAGLPRYFTGRPCPNGHTADRYTRSSACVECVSANVARARADYAKDQGEPREAQRRAYALDVQSVPVLLPAATLEPVAGIVAALLVARYPLLQEDRRYNFGTDRVCTRAADQGGGILRAWFNAHRDDAATVRTLATNAMRSAGTPS